MPIELLAPAKNLECGIEAIKHGADAVYGITGVGNEVDITGVNIAIVDIGDPFFGTDERNHFGFGVEIHIEAFFVPISNGLTEREHPCGRGILMIGGIFAGTNFNDKPKAYEENVASVEAYSNTLETAVPQTEIYSRIKAHFEAPLSEGKTEKKVIVIGYDGCRADALTMLDENGNGAISNLLSKGASAEIAYCGGVNYPAINTQATSTAPGWCSILTGVWADKTGITGNGITKCLRVNTAFG